MKTGRATPDLSPVLSRWLLLAVALVPLLAGCGGAAARTAGPAVAPPPLVSFVFDDGNDTDLLVAQPLFAAQGAVASAAVTIDRIGTPEYLTADQVRELARAGWEIMSHTVSHPRLTTLAPAAVDDELARSKRELEALGVRVTNLVYPYNGNNAVVREIAGRYYRAARGGGSAVNHGIADRTLLKSFPLTHDDAAMERLVDQAAAGGWLIFYLHEVNAKIKLTETSGEFRRGETLRFSPSGATGRFTVSHWFPLYGTHLYFVPLSGQPRPGDMITGVASGARARFDDVMYDKPAQLTRLLGYIRERHPRMRIVTVDQALDLLGVPSLASN